jgi:translation initiation factor IF-3
LRLAAEAELDLVEVAAAAKPPVCRIVDYGKFRYDAERKEKLARRNQVRVAVKEVRLRPKIGEHDFAWKLDQVRGFLEQNAKVKIAVIFRGRERGSASGRTADGSCSTASQRRSPRTAPSSRRRPSRGGRCSWSSPRRERVAW